KNLKVDEIKTDKGKIKSFENVETEISMEIDSPKPKNKVVKKKNSLVQTFINFVSKDAEKLHTTTEKKNKNETLETPSTETPSHLDYSEGSFKILRKSKKVSTQPPTQSEEKQKLEAPKEDNPQSVTEEITQEKVNLDDTVSEYKTRKPELEVKIIYQEAPKESREDEIPKYSNRKVDIPLNDLLVEESVIKGEPIKEMKLLFEKLLNVVGTVTKTITSAFYLVNRTKNELVLQAIVSHKPEALKKQRKLPLDGDLVSQIVHRGKPEIIDFTTSTAELDLLPYYEKPAGARTFIGVPLMLRGSIIGVLCADSTAPDAFDNYTMNFFLHYARVFSFFMESYTEKYELLLESQILSLVDEMRKGYFAGAAKFSESMKHIFQTILNIFDFETFGLCLYDFDSKFYRIFLVRSKNNIDVSLKNKRVDLKNTLLGKALLEKRILNVEFDEKRVRAHYLESKLKHGNFVAVPIKTI
ncbi:MAG: GAF domain-containing protein, partial [Candidatus Kapaibacteriota bacterium]